MKFSVIIPVYKFPDYLPQCVDSVLKQEFTDFELILVDDGSPDNCGEICDEYAKKDSRVVVIHKENGGAADARNCGIREAKGEYLCFLDGDDYWVDERILTKINEKIKEKKVDIVQLGYTFYYQLQDKYGGGMVAQDRDYLSLTDAEILLKLVQDGTLNPSAWGMCLSREFVCDNGLYFVRGRIIEDIGWMINMMSLSPRITVVADKVYVYRKERMGSVTATMGNKHLADHCDVIEKSIQLLEGIENDVKYPLMNYLMYQTLICIALTCRKRVRLTKLEKKELRNRLKIICQKNIKKYKEDRRVKLAVKIYSIFGFGVMVKILGYYLNHRGR